MKNKVGRPSIYTPELALTICKRIAEGESVRTICKDKDMPGRVTINAWLLRTEPEYKEFKSQYARARVAQAANMFEDMIDIAINEDKDTNRARLIIDTMKWTLSKMIPKEYGDRIQQDHTVNTDESITDAIAAARKKLDEALEEK